MSDNIPTMLFTPADCAAIVAASGLVARVEALEGILLHNTKRLLAEPFLGEAHQSELERAHAPASDEATVEEILRLGMAGSVITRLRAKLSVTVADNERLRQEERTLRAELEAARREAERAKSLAGFADTRRERDAALARVEELETQAVRICGERDVAEAELAKVREERDSAASQLLAMATKHDALADQLIAGKAAHAEAVALLRRVVSPHENSPADVRRCIDAVLAKASDAKADPAAAESASTTDVAGSGPATCWTEGQ